MITNETFMYYIAKIVHTMQVAWIGSTICGFLAYLSPAYLPVGALLICIFTDLIFGIIAARCGKVPVTSRRLRKSAVKSLCYVVLVLLLYHTEQVFIGDWIAPHKIAAGILCLTELISILENIVVITDGHPGAKKVLRWIRGQSDTKFGSLAEDISEEKKNG